MCVPKVGRQNRQAPLGVFAVSISAQQSLESKSVAKIVQARSAAVVLTTQPNLPGQSVKRPVYLTFVQAVTVLVYQERTFGARTKAAVSAFRIITEDLTG